MKELQSLKQWVKDYKKAVTLCEDLEILYEYFKEGDVVEKELENHFTQCKEHIENIDELAAALNRARSSTKSYVISLVTDSHKISPEGGCWWEVAVPEVSSNEKSEQILSSYKDSKTKQPY